MEGMKAGDSVAVNGVCLTVTGISHPTFNVDIMPETLRKTNLHQCKAGEKVNLERALPAWPDQRLPPYARCGARRHLPLPSRERYAPAG
jgi:riboflavin synthase alpha subunit